MREILQAAAPIEGQAAPMPAVGPVLNEEAIRDWKKKDVLARRILLTTIEPKLQNTLVGCKTAHQIWIRLSSQHNKCAANNRYVIQRKFMNYDYQQGHDAMSHISAIENLAEQLKNMGEAPTLLQITTKIIYTLPPHLRGFITTWESLPEEEQTIPLLT